MSDDIKDRPRSLSPSSAFKAIMVEQAGAMSEPPAVKQSRLQTEAAVDIFTIAMLTLLLVTKAVPGWEPHALGAIVLIGGGAQALQAMGKRGGSVAALVGVMPWVMKGLAARLVMVVPLAFMLTGCASFYSETNDAINTTAVKINQAQPAVLLLCQADPGERCDDARKAYEAAGAAVEAAHAANEVARLTSAGVDEVGKALRVLADRALEVADALAAE